MRRSFIVVIGGCAAGVCLGQNHRPGTLDLCTVAANIQTYNRQQVRITAFLGVGGEQTVLYDPKCEDGNPLVYVSFNSKVIGQMRALRRIVKKKRYAFVTIEGTMHGQEPLQVDPHLPDWLKERFKGALTHYGHLGSLDMMIDVARVVEATDVDDGFVPKAATSAMPREVEMAHEVHHAAGNSELRSAAR